MVESFTTTTITTTTALFSECCWPKQTIHSSTNPTTTTATAPEIANSWGSSATFPWRTCEANDYAEHAVSTRNQSLHSELNQSDGTIGYAVKSTTVPEFWQITFLIYPKSQKYECHCIEVGKVVSRTSTSSIFLICKWTCSTSLYSRKRWWTKFKE